MWKAVRKLWGASEEASAPAFPTGIEVLYPGEDGSAEIDIVFVHGLTGNRRSTWTAKGEETPWPQALLPREILHARIFTFGYDANVLRWEVVSNNNIGNHAENLLVALANYRDQDDTNDRPIIFVAHGLGGLVCKEATLLSWNAADDHLRKIGSCTRAFLFLGTPHSGSDKASWIEPLARTVSNVKQANYEILQVLRRDSEVLARIQKAFHTRLRYEREKGHSKIAITCFYEELPVKGIGMIVPKDSAIISEYIAIGIRENHSNMVKFGNKDHPGFVSFLLELKRLMKCSIERDDNPTTERVKPTYTDEIVTACLRSLSFPRIDNRRDAIAEAHEGTCDWILNDQILQEWLHRENIDQHNGVFWIKGKPGVGKSTLMKHIVLHCTRTLPDHTIVAYFFNARGSTLEKTPLGMIRSLLYQLLDHNRQLCEQFIYLFLDKEEKHGHLNWEWELPELMDLLLDLTKTACLPPLLLFVDALDECDESQVGKLVSFLERLSMSTADKKKTFNICLSSRHYPSIRIAKAFEITVERSREHDDDISAYIRSGLRLRDKEIEAELLRKADGVFQWIMLVVEIVNKAYDEGNISTMHAMLQEIPGDLDKLLSKLLDKDTEHRKETLLMLQWVLFAERRLSPEELYFAVYSRTHPEGLGPWNKSVVSPEEMKRSITTRSKGLIEIREFEPNYFGKNHFYTQFIHETVNDLLLNNRRLEFLDADLQGNLIGASQERLFACCMSYVMMPQLGPLVSNGSDRKELSANFPFLSYASRNLLRHADAALEYSDERRMEEMTLTNLRVLKDSAQSLNQFNTFRAICDNVFPDFEEGVELLYLACRNNCFSLTKWLLSNNVNVNAQGGRFGNALQAASYWGSVGLVEILVHAGANVSAQGGEYGNALQAASFNNDKVILKTLLQAGAAVNAQGGKYGNALQAASFVNDEKGVRALLQAGADINAQGGQYDSVLQAASCMGDASLIESLIQAGANVNAQGGYYGSALQAASYNNTSDVVEALLQAGADVNAQGGEFGNALQAAALNQYKVVFNVLLQAGADANAQGGEFGNALQAASFVNDEGYVRALLQAGADVNAQGGRYGSALKAALHCGHADIVQLLKEAGAVS